MKTCVFQQRSQDIVNGQRKIEILSVNNTGCGDADDNQTMFLMHFSPGQLLPSCGDADDNQTGFSNVFEAFLPWPASPELW